MVIRNVFFIPVVLLMSMYLSAQDFPFPDSNAEWITKHEASYCTGGSSRILAWREYLDGDTTIDNVVYHIVMFQPECYRGYGGYNCVDFYVPAMGGPYAIGGIREDTERVFFYKFNVPDSLFSTYERVLSDIPNDEEMVLYDFDWTGGDTIAYPREGQDSLYFRVVSTGQENDRKIISLHSINEFGHFHTVVEGMGAKAGLFGMYYKILGADYLPVDICFYHNEELIQDGPCNACGFISGVEDIEPLSVHIYPNPANNSVIIRSGENELYFNLNVFNSLGQLIYSSPGFQNGSELDIRDWTETGLMFFHINDLRGNSVSKGVIVR